MAKEIKHFMDKPDIGSGEKNAGQREVEGDVASVRGTRRKEVLDGRHLQNIVEEQQYADAPSSLSGVNLDDAQREQDILNASHTPGKTMTSEQEQARGFSRVLQQGIHIARMTATQLPDGTFEAQVFVRLAREPEIAETYIPAGTFTSEAEAWTAAEQRARRALDEHEF